MQRVLVTGASGFIGGHITRALLADNKEVIALKRPGSAPNLLCKDGVEQRVGVLEDPASLERAVEGCDTVFHLAGLTKALRVEDLMHTNAEGTAAVARVCAAQETPPTLVYASSLAAAGPSCGTEPLTESRPAAPVSNYGRSKLAGEEALRVVAAEVPISIVRPPMVFGEADPGMLTMFTGLKRSRLHLMPGFRRRQYSVIYVADLARLCLQVVERGERLAREFNEGQGIYYAESASRLSYADLGRRLGRALNHVITIPLPVPNALVWLVGAMADIASRASGKSRYMSVDKAREATAGSWVCSAEKAISQLGFQLPTDLQPKLDATADWYRSHGWL